MSARKRTAAQRRATAKLLERVLHSQASPAEPFSWESKLAMLLTVVRGDRMLVITMTARTPAGHAWLAMAIERASGVEGLARASAKSAPGFLEDHAHDMITEAASFSTVVRMSEAYARKWIRRRERRDPCPCPPIMTPGRTRAERKEQKERIERAERGVATRRRRRGGK